MLGSEWPLPLRLCSFWGRSVHDKLKLPKWTKVFFKNRQDWPSRPVKLPCPSVGQRADVPGYGSPTALLSNVQPRAGSLELETAGMGLPLLVATLSAPSANTGAGVPPRKPAPPALPASLLPG